MTDKNTEAKEPMAPAVTHKTIKVKVTTHPNEWKYVGMESNEYNKALYNYMFGLTPEQLTQENCVVNTKKTKDFIKTLKSKDIVGILTQKYEVLGIDKTQGIITVKSVLEKYPEEKTVGMAEIDKGLQINYAEILYRNGKPFNTEKEKEVKVVIRDWTQKKEEKEENGKP